MRGFSMSFGYLDDEIFNRHFSVKGNAVLDWHSFDASGSELNHEVTKLTFFHFWETDGVGEKCFDHGVLVLAANTFCYSFSFS